MSDHPIWISEGTEAYMAAAFAKREGVHYLLVVDRDCDLCGVTCRCDIDRAGVGERVGEFARSPVTYVNAGERAERARDIMVSCGIGCLPVMRDPGDVAGILTRHDLSAAGLWSWEWGVTLCASCGSHHGLIHRPDGLAFCRECLDATPAVGSLERRWYCTLGQGD